MTLRWLALRRPTNSRPRALTGARPTSLILFHVLRTYTQIATSAQPGCQHTPCAVAAGPDYYSAELA